MRRLRDTTLVPPGGFRYTDPDTGFTTSASTHYDWVANSKAHRQANNLPLPLDFQARVEDQLCGIIPPEYCDREPGDVKWVDTKFGWNDFIEGMKVFGRWALEDAPLVQQEEADRRAAICTSCPLNVDVSGCSTCHKLASAITGAVAKRVSAHNDYLRACAICRCALKAMVWMPLDLLMTNETSERQDLRPDFCWLKNAGAEQS